MNRLLHHAAFAVGLLAVAWVGAGYLPGNPLALALVALIGAFYAMGALELHRYQQATDGLLQHLAATDTAPPELGRWLARLPAGLQDAVRLRITGERVALPGPALAPTLAGLLVLLGMLGTFLGMVVTLKGTGLALENATDVQAIRASLAAPVQGLGLAFGCSVAGVAASAMLGLMSALARRERQQAARQLDRAIAGVLRGFSQAQQREESLQLLRTQSALMGQALPALVTQIQGLVAQMATQGQALQDGLLAGQARFHDEAQRAYTGLAASVDRSLQTSLAESARLAGATIEPAVQATLAGLARETTALHQALSQAVQQQLDGVTARLDGSTAALVDAVALRLEHSTEQSATAWRQALDAQQQGQQALLQHTAQALSATVAGFEQHASTLLRGVAEAQTAWEAAAAERERQRLAALHDNLAATSAALQQQRQQAEQAAAERQQQICTTLERTAQAITEQAAAQARATLDEITRLLEVAAEAPRAAAALIGGLRSALSDSLVRDNAALDERNRLLATLGGLLDAVNHASTEQRQAIDALVQATTTVLDRAGSGFAQHVAAGAQTLDAVAAQVTGSAAEVASLGEGFGVAVQLFSRASEQLMAQLQRIETALGQSTARSDEQMAYYVAQAREIVDLTLGSHKQIVDELQRARAPAEADIA